MVRDYPNGLVGLLLLRFDEILTRRLPTCLSLVQPIASYYAMDQRLNSPVALIARHSLSSLAK